MADPIASPADPPPPAAPAAAGASRWRAPEWATLIPAFAPTAVALVLLALAALVLLVAPRFLAQPPESFRAAPTAAFLWTRVEAQRLQTSKLLRDGTLAEHLEPWRDVPASGVGSTGYDPGKGSLFDAALAKLREATHALDPTSLAHVLDGLGQGNQATVLYHGALALYRGGDLAQAEARAEKTLDRIKSGRPGRDEAASMRLDGEQATTAYLLGHIRLKRDNLDGALRAFDEALKAARTARSYAAYRTQADPLLSLDPRFSLTDLSLSDIWNDDLVALNRKDPKRALAEAAQLYDTPTAVVAHPRLAATLQAIAAEAGQPDRVAAVNPDWPAVGGDETLARARQISAAAMLVMGDGALMSELEGSPERDLFTPWVQLARERQLVKAEIAQTPDAAAPVAVGATGEQGAFLRRWRAEYLGRLGADFLDRARQEHQRGYYATVLRSQVFPAPVAFSAATRWWGLNPWLAGLLFAVLTVIPMTAAFGGLVYYETFSPLHFTNRLRKARKAAGDPLRARPSVTPEGGA